MKNLIVGQSGGPTAVINSSLAGVFSAARAKKIPKIYGMCYGIQGLLEEKTLDLSDAIKTTMDMELLKRTPSSFLGSCRYKLPDVHKDEALYGKIFKILEKMQIGYFLYIGGNDSMDTIEKLSSYGRETGSEIRFIGIPKTIDNDLAVTDHTPGFGSAAKYIGGTCKEIIRDGLVYDMKSVTVIEIMGRNSGWLTASAVLAKGDDGEGMDAIYLPERVLDTDQFLNKISNLQRTKKSLNIAVSEGIRLEDGRYVCELKDGRERLDAFGHKQLTGTAAVLSEMIGRDLGCKTRFVELNILQRCAAHLASLTDVNEAFAVGEYGVKAALEGESEKMVVLERISDVPYVCIPSTSPIADIANIEKKLPDQYITKDGDNVSKEFLGYLRPLVAGEHYPVMKDGIFSHLVRR